jgi:hypothetical protein
MAAIGIEATTAKAGGDDAVLVETDGEFTLQDA